MRNDDVVVISACRTPIGNFGGAFREMPAERLLATTFTETLRRSGIAPEWVDQVIAGHASGRTDALNIARLAWLIAGFPENVPGFSVEMMCGSGLRAIQLAVQSIQTGEAQFALAGGVEVMSRYRYVAQDGIRWGYRMGSTSFLDTLDETFTDPLTQERGAIVAERLAEKYGVTREDADRFAWESHQRAVAARENGRFDEEIFPVTVADKRGEREIRADEHPRKETTLEALARLPAAFQEGGTVTAGNASGICDGAAALLLTTADQARALGKEPLAKVVTSAFVAVDPRWFGIAPAPSIRQALDRAGLRMADVDLYEINEAFASQYVAVERELQLDRNQVNVNGGAIALGHPVGCSGARLPVTLLYEMRRRNASIGVASLCVGGGLGITTVFEGGVD